MCEAVLDVLAQVALWASVDAWSDYRDQLPAEVEAAQAALRELQATRDGVETGMGIDIDRTDAEQEALLRTYAAWSIHVEVLPAAEQEALAVLHDGASSLTAELTDAEVYRLRQRLEGIATLDLLEHVHAWAREQRERHQRRRQRLPRWLRSGGPRTDGSPTAAPTRPEQPAPVDGGLLAEFARRDQLQTTVVLGDGTRLPVFNIAAGYDMGDEWAHVTTNVSPDCAGAPVDFFFTSDVVELVDPDTGQRVWPSSGGA
ncbi:hypothetical protein GCM10009528_35870 [Kineococcus aurantiacus]